MGQIRSRQIVQCYLADVLGGRITRAWVNWDLVAVMEQIGCIERAATASA